LFLFQFTLDHLQFQSQQLLTDKLLMKARTR